MQGFCYCCCCCFNDDKVKEVDPAINYYLEYGLSTLKNLYSTCGFLRYINML